ncbi:hypothetical protein P3G55_26965, partial [Leptospira sp. 96542]|nr:hypothetical protein [Leptospira sp. 96542]
CIGVHLWLRLRDWYRRRLVLFAIVAVLVPLLALLGVLAAARALPQSGATSGTDAGYGYGSDSSYGTSSAYGSGGGYGGNDSGYDSAYGSAYGSAESAYGASAYGGSGVQGGAGPARRLAWLIPADLHAAQSVYAALGVLALLLLLIAMRITVQAWERRHGLVTVRYASGREVKAVRGASVLDR